MPRNGWQTKIRLHVFVFVVVSVCVYAFQFVLWYFALLSLFGFSVLKSFCLVFGFLREKEENMKLGG